MITATCPTETASDWRRQWREAITDPDELLRMLHLEAFADRVIRPQDGEFPLRVPRNYVARMRLGAINDPLLRQVLPVREERLRAPGFALDAVGDLASRVDTGVLHKYPGRALLIATGSCAVHCRYCFRRHFPYQQETAARDHWQAAIATVRADASIEELLLSGGDPLALATDKLRELTSGLANIRHLRRLRIHTRLPVVLPARVDDALCAWLQQLPWPLAIVLHINHAQEIHQELRTAVARLRDSGAVVFNQSVLLSGVNDSVDTLADLSAALFAAGIVPYYVHLLDRVQGSAHFEVAEATAITIEQALRARLPGYLLPRFVREQAGQSHKTPLHLLAPGQASAARAGTVPATFSAMALK